MPDPMGTSRKRAFATLKQTDYGSIASMNESLKTIYADHGYALLCNTYIIGAPNNIRKGTNGDGIE